jgi:hypothetical protein
VEEDDIARVLWLSLMGGIRADVDDSHMKVVDKAVG